jgi:hypothetical protein
MRLHPFRLYETWSKRNSYPDWVYDAFEEICTKYPNLSDDARSYMLILTIISDMTEEEALKWPGMALFLRKT